MKKIVFVSLLSLLNFSVANAEVKYKTCTSSREFITTLTFLKSKKEFSLSQKDAFATAMDVAKGCTFSATRFINALDLLHRISLATSDAIKIAKRVAHSTDAKSDAFQDVLKRSFTKKYLDLPLKDSVDYAMALSIDFKGDPTIAHGDFKQLVEFCKDEDHLEMPIMKCAEVALNVSRLTNQFAGSLAGTFINLFEFLIDRKGPNLPTYQALEMSTDLISSGPMVYENFKEAYQFAISKEPGLDYDRKSSVLFAKKLARHSKKKKTKTGN